MISSSHSKRARIAAATNNTRTAVQRINRFADGSMASSFRSSPDNGQNPKRTSGLGCAPIRYERCRGRSVQSLPAFRDGRAESDGPDADSPHGEVAQVVCRKKGNDVLRELPAPVDRN